MRRLQCNNRPAPRRGAITGVLFLVVLLAGTPAHGQSQYKPVDEFSERIDALLEQVEGNGFPDSENLASWHQRRGEIQQTLAEIVSLAGDDEQRRQAAVETLVTAESIAVEPSEAQRLIDRTRGEVRAWARRKISGYYSMGLTPEDRKRVGAEVITALKASWRNTDVPHPLRNVAAYEGRAAALRALSRFDPPSCK